MLRLSQSTPQTRLNCWPFVRKDGVHDGVAFEAVGHDHVVAEGAFFQRSEFLDGALAMEVARIGLELNADAAEGFEGVLEHEQLHLRIDLCAAELFVYPRTANLNSAVFFANVEVATRANCMSCFLVDHDKCLGVRKIR